MQTFFLLFPPDFFPALLLGLISGAGFKLWKYAKGSCLLAPLFWYAYGGWLFSCFIVLFSNAAMLNGFFVGLSLAFFQPLLGLFFRGYERIAEFWRDRAYMRQERKREQERKTHKNSSSHQTHHSSPDEKVPPSSTEGTRKQREHTQQEPPKSHYQESPRPKTPPLPPESDTRTPEEVLGLNIGWTQDDLLKAYRRESQRLHPDKWTGKPPVIQEAMEQEFKRVQEAYKRLKK